MPNNKIDVHSIMNAIAAKNHYEQALKEMNELNADLKKYLPDDFLQWDYEDYNDEFDPVINNSDDLIFHAFYFSKDTPSKLRVFKIFNDGTIVITDFV